MIDKLNKIDFNELESYFNNYCIITYGKKYPLTANNIKKYLEEVVLHFYFENDIELKENENFKWKESEELECDIMLKGDILPDTTAFIRENKLCNKYILNDLEESLIEMKNDNNKP